MMAVERICASRLLQLGISHVYEHGGVIIHNPIEVCPTSALPLLPCLGPGRQAHSRGKTRYGVAKIAPSYSATCFNEYVLWLMWWMGNRVHVNFAAAMIGQPSLNNAASVARRFWAVAVD